MTDTWNTDISALQGASILQTSLWGTIKQNYGWEPFYKTWKDENGKFQAAALILERTVTLFRFFHARVQYVPRGPLLLDWADDYWRNKVLDDLQKFADDRKAIFIKIDPEVILGTGVPGREEAEESEIGARLEKELFDRKWRYSSDQIQFKNTAWLDLTPPQDEWMSRMKQKTRYNVRLASRKGVTVRIGNKDDLPMLYMMYAETSIRDGFIIRPEEYYIRLWSAFMDGGMAEPLIAEVEGEPIAGIFLFHFAQKSWYLHGMSRDLHREKMPNYYLQWEAMKRSHELGCHTYDLWGAPTIFNESDSMWGVFRFKEGLGGKVIRTLGAWDYPSKPLFYSLYTGILPKILGLLRRHRKAQTQSENSL